MKSQKAKKNVGEEKGSRAESWGLADYHFYYHCEAEGDLQDVCPPRPHSQGLAGSRTAGAQMSCTFCAARCGEYPDRPSCSGVGLSQM
jgi:hypothetical protein